MPDDAWRQHGAGDRVAQGRHRLRNTARRFALAALLAPLALCAITRGVEPTPGKPATKPATGPTTRVLERSAAARAVKLFRDALKAGDPAAAMKSLASSPQPVRDAERRVKRLTTTLSAGGYDFSILDAREAGDAAVVLINDHLKDGRKTIDIKPWYLLRQDGEWKLLGKFTDFELKEYGFDEARLKEYRALETWAESREPQLRKDQPDCGC